MGRTLGVENPCGIFAPGPVGDQLCALIGLCSQCVQNTSPEMPKQIQRTSKVETLLCDQLCQLIGEFSMRAERIFRNCRSKSSEPVKHGQQQARNKTHESHWPVSTAQKGNFRKVDAERIIWQTSCQGSVVSEAKKSNQGQIEIGLQPQAGVRKTEAITSLSNRSSEF